MTISELGRNFEVLTADRMKRVGIIDVGSNSVRLVVFDGATRSPAYFFNENVQCGLGASLEKTGKLDPDGRARALRALKRFALLTEGMQVSSLTAIGTAAVRDSLDGPEFCDKVEMLTGIRIRPASGEEEARLAAHGVILGWPSAAGLVCDLGGSSTEFVEVSDGEIGKCSTTRFGHLALAQNQSPSLQTGMIKEALASLQSIYSDRYPALLVVGGSWREFARIDMERREYPLRVLDNYKMSVESALKTAEWIEQIGSKTLRSISKVRAAALPGVGLLLKELVDQFSPAEIRVSAYGIREGLLYQHMPEQLRQRDPLIEACLYSERTAARLPGFGDKLFEFVKPLFKFASAEQLRLVRAACLLHDVTWRAHPDYRAEISFDRATRANLGGIDHAGRIFLALALFHRYKNSGSFPAEGYTKLLPTEDVHQAEILGRAIRFGSMFTGSMADKIGKLKFGSKRHVLTLFLPDSLKDIYGEVVEARFASLAKAMDCEARVEVV